MYKLSIIIPSLRPIQLRKLVNYIYLNTKLSWEIIAVVKDVKHEEFIHLKTGLGNAFKLVEDKELLGTTRAINQALPLCTGEYIVTLSDDCKVMPGWADLMIAEMEQKSLLNPDIIFIGNFIVYDNTGIMPKIGYYGKQFSMFPILKRWHILKLGGYYSTEFYSFYADPDLGIRLALNGGKIANSELARIFHPYNPDALHQYNKSEYFNKDEETFKNKWKNCFINEPFKGCEVIE